MEECRLLNAGEMIELEKKKNLHFAISNEK